MNRRKSNRRSLSFTTGNKLIYIVTGTLLTIAGLLLANDKLYQGSAKMGDPLLVLTLGAGILGAILMAKHWQPILVDDYAVAVFGYVAIGMCIGTVTIGVIYDGQPIKWVAPCLLILFPISEWWSGLVAPKTTTKIAAPPKFGE